MWGSLSQDLRALWDFESCVLDNSNDCTTIKCCLCAKHYAKNRNASFITICLYKAELLSDIDTYVIPLFTNEDIEAQTDQVPFLKAAVRILSQLAIVTARGLSSPRSIYHSARAEESLRRGDPWRSVSSQKAVRKEIILTMTSHSWRSCATQSCKRVLFSFLYHRLGN